MPAGNIALMNPNARARSPRCDQIRDVCLRDADVPAGDALEDARGKDDTDRRRQAKPRGNVGRKPEHGPWDRRADLADDEHHLAPEPI